MAKDYKVRARPGRYKQQDIGGNLGLRNLAQAHQVQIDALKGIARQAERYDKAYIQGEDRKHANQEWNSAKIWELEKEKFENRRKWVDTTGRLEVKFLLSKADEYKAQSDYWADFSTTHSKNFAKLAQASWTAADNIIGEQHFESNEDRLDELLKLNIEAENKIAEKITEDSYKEKKKGNDSEANELQSFLGLGRNRSSMLAAEKFKDNIKTIPSIIKDISVKRDETGAIIENLYVASEVHALYEKFAKNYIKTAGIKENSKGGQEILEISKSLAAAEYYDLKKLDTAKNDTKNQDTALRSFIADPSKINWNNLVALMDGRTVAVRGGYSTVQDRGSNLSDASLEAYNLVIQTKKYGSFEDSLKDTFLHTRMRNTGEEKLTDAQLGTWLKKTSLVKYEQLKELWLKQQDKQYANEQTEVKTNQLKELSALDQRVNNKDAEDYIDINTPEGMANLGVRVQQAHAEGNTLIVEKYSPIANFNKKSRVPHTIRTELIKAHAEGNEERFMSLFAGLEGDLAFAEFRWMKDDLRLLVSHQRSGSQLKQLAKDKIIQYRDQAFRVPGMQPSPSERGAVQAYQEQWYKVWNKNETIENVQQRIEATDKVLEGMLANKESGLFRRTDAGGIVTWLAFAPEPDPVKSMSLEFIHNQAVRGTTFDQVIDMQNDSGSVVSQDARDGALKALSRGLTIPANDNISALATLYGLSESDVWNELMPELSVKPNQVDQADLQVQFSNLGVNPLYYKSLHKNNKIRCGIVCGIYNRTGELPMRPWIKDYAILDGIDTKDIYANAAQNDYTYTDDGHLKFQDMPSAIRDLYKFGPGFWFDPENNTIRTD